MEASRKKKGKYLQSKLPFIRFKFFSKNVDKLIYILYNEETEIKQHKTENITRCNSVWQSAWFGTKMPQVQVLSPRPNQIPLLIQSCRQRYRYFTEKNIDIISTYKNKRCIWGVFHPSCNAFFIVFIAPPRDLTQCLYRPIVKQPLFDKRLKSQMYHLIRQWNVLNGYGK